MYCSDASRGFKSTSLNRKVSLLAALFSLGQDRKGCNCAFVCWPIGKYTRFTCQRCSRIQKASHDAKIRTSRPKIRRLGSAVVISSRKCPDRMLRSSVPGHFCGCTGCQCGFYAHTPATSSAYRYKSSIVQNAGEMVMTSSVWTKKVSKQKESGRRTLPYRTLAACVRSQPKAGAKRVQQSLAPLLPRTLAALFLYARKIDVRTLAGVHVHQQSLELQASCQLKIPCMVSLSLQIWL